MTSISGLDKSTIVYLDESGIDDNEEYTYGPAPKGERLHAMKNADRNKRLSIISVLRNKQLIAPFVFEGYCNSEVFETYLQGVLAPELKQGQTVIMYNTSFHKGKSVERIITAAKCNLLYLPTYSPDFNPIEHYWNSINHRMRHYMQSVSKDLYLAAEHAFDIGNC